VICQKDGHEMKLRALSIAFGVGLLLQLAMVVTGHFVPVVKNNVFAVGGMAISLFAGFLYARFTTTAWGDSLVGGAVSGGTCALLGIALSAFLKDVPASVLAFGTMASIVTGVAGSALGRMFR
jgi:hypothetical protein